MWIAFPIPLRLSLPNPIIILPETYPQSERRFAVAVSASATSHNAGEDIGGLGHAVISALKSKSEPLEPKTPSLNNSNPIPKQQKHQKQKQEEEGEEEGRQELRGSDVLWALQRAAAQKNKISGGKKKRKGLISVGSSEKGGINEEDYSNVRPLCIKSDWAARLDELERCLQELSDT